ncbi:dynein heavy chain 2, axonemal [Suricata suricatta]|uniref:dynein heavy chain 2, axonemal n=1 Tax=Suricata suricatta TaxID=37032 RepID=UPI00115594DF|nr:dynein heavy chain 2, axonemal [Suricata suricatta]
MASRAEKKQRLSAQGTAGRGARRRAAQAANASRPAKVPLPPEPELEPEPEPEPDPDLEEPEAEKEEFPEPEADVKPLFLSRAALTGLADAEWTAEHDAILEHFAQDPSEPVLTIFVDACAGLRLDLGMPVQTQNQIVYFIRQAPVAITPENFEATVQFGTVRGSYIPALLRLLSGVFAPLIFANTTWPESIRSHFASHLHRFLACLTDTRYKLEGHTVLYIPAEAANMVPEVVVKDKELVQRLETSMIHWTRQIKEVLSAQESVEIGENLGPLEEIEFWRNRCMDLSGISKQLVKQGVRHTEATLRLAKSSYVAPFVKLAQQIQDGFHQAQSNLTFLSILKEPYQELASVRPKDVASKLPKLISLIRVIWVNSPHYNTRERLTSLFRKMSNEIIRLCCRAVSLDRIFEGYVASSKEELQGCISCCQAWKDHYLQAVHMHTQFSSRSWVLDQTSIFAQVDAFVQRCKDLIEVCDCQHHFARWEDGKQGPFPCFFGAQGPHITRNLLEIEDIFHKNLHTLRAVRGGILDVKNTSWHEDYSRFRSAVKDLEVMTQNLITSAFELVRDVEQGVLLLDTFHRLSSREAIKRTYDKKVVDLYMLFNSELALVNRELNKKWLFLEPYMAEYSGHAHWMRLLRRRIDRVMNCLSSAHFLPHIGTGEESAHTYQQMVQAIDELVRKTFQDWTCTLDKDCVRRLDTPLLRTSQEKAGMLEVNFDKSLLILFVEIDYWERLLFETPHYVAHVAERAEDLRILRENLLLVARDYNRIIAMLSPEEQALFKERIRFLDKKIHPGLKNLHWALKGASAFFITECRIHASKVQAIVNEFKASTLTIGWRAQEISETLLVRITGKRVYRDLEFEEDQREHRAATQRKLLSLHQDVVAILTDSYEVFKNDGPEVQQQWVLYMIRLDRMMEDALRLNVKCSLLELSRAINGDGKTMPNPLFRVLVTLQSEAQGGVAQVEFSPTLQTLASVVNDIGSHLFSTISVFRHLPEILLKHKFHRDPIHVLMERDEDVRKIQAQISSGVANNAGLLQSYLKTWDLYREIWEISKDSFIRRYQRLNPPVSSFDADIARYTEVANNVQKEETVLNIQFVLLDCSHLKLSLVQHCNEWQNKFTALLKEMAARSLLELHTYLRENGDKISRPPQTLEELGVSLQLMETLQHDLLGLEAQIPPIHEQFTILEKYEVSVEDSVLEMLNSLNGEWATFQQTLLDSEQMLRKHKEKFKTSLIHSADDFKKKAHSLLEDFEFRGPFTSNVGHQSALEQIAQVRAMLTAMREEENSLRSNLGIFKIEQPISKDLQHLEKVERGRALHWDQVREEIQRDFDQESESFTLEQIVELGMDQHVERIGEISASATRELAIELALQNITKTWEVIQLDIVPYRDKGHHRLRGTEEVFQALEDNQVALSTMKASRFVKAFEKEVDQWERCLSLVLEVVEMVLTVQRQWMYLENIFLGEDIRKQLPSESAMFDQINSTWKRIMDRISKDSNALRSTHHPGLLDTLIEMNTVLEDIQKSLDMYLETKRHTFPRFYFLSNDDLLEILGQSRNPEAVQPHLKKCFDNIKLLKMQKVGGPSSKWEAVGMFSADGEYVDFLHAVLLEGPVESWLGDVERAMRATLRDLLRNCRVALKKFLNKRDKWVKEWPGQVVITASQIQWTADVTKCLMTAKERGDKKILKVMKKKQVSMLSRYSEAIRGNLTKIMRLKVVALVTIEIHARDVLEKIYKSGLMDTSSFDWLSQLRVYWEKDLDDCVIRQTNTQFQYGYEYLGNSGRLVITPLTDRCYMTLTTALHLHRGGSPKGPAGTGKTETVKDLGKALGTYVIVVNCSEGLDYKSMGKMYSGLAQTGAWGCFDEFNRINVEVLSVVAQQILSILSALAANLTRFHFEGFEINLVWSCGIFITMNPGYAGRTELPDNLKSMFRPIAMVVPDSTLIAEILLFGEGFGNCKEFPLNPKALSLGELYGEYDLSTNEWTDGVLSSVMRAACADEKPDEKWIVFDGPVDTLWIESMNSVMDDNKVLTLINGERIALPEQVSLLFEVENLAVASPATVSRCGMVYMDYADLGWKPYVQSWLEKRPKAEAEPLQRMFEKFINKMLTFKKDYCNELVPLPEYSGIISLCKLYSALATPENGVNPADGDNYVTMVELTFVFSMIWSVCASVDEEGRKKIDSYLREIEGSFPNKDTVYEYFVDPKMRNWMSFEEMLPKSWRYPPNSPFYKIMVPTVDTVRYNYLVSALVASQTPVLLVGPVGTGKTSIAQSVLQSLPSSQWSVLTVNMSAQTTSNNVQSIIESRVEKRTKGVYVPFGGKSMITFMDDLNMPAKDMFGSQPPLELLRLWIDYGFWYDRMKQTVKYIRDMFLMAAMGPPGGGRTIISPRLQSRFNIINMTFPTESQIIRIFGTMVNQKLQDFEEEVKPIGNVVTEATLDVYNTVVQRFLPTPAKIHYLFNLRDISKVFQGMLRANKDFHDTKASITRLWIHECFRVFSDRLVDATDMEAFVGIISDKLGSFFDLTFHNLCPNKRSPIFGDFMREPKVYEDLTDLAALKAAMEMALREYNLSPTVVPMQLVLFREAIEHITRIVRVIGQPRGNMLLVGIGGSGRQSLARLASSICEYTTFQIEVTKHYRKQEFREDIKRLYRQTGVELKATAFLFVDTQIAEESFLEDINNILSSGEVPNLYKTDEFEEIQTLISEQAKAEQLPLSSDSLFAYLIERVRNNLHIILCLSPVGDPFRNWVRQYPALVNCTTINWFSEWPHDALLEVAEKYLLGVDLGTQENIHRKVAKIFVTMHWSVAQYSQRMLLELRRHNYVTPTNYLELVSGFKKLLAEKRQELLDQANKLRTGLFKIDETRQKVEVMSLELEEAKKKVAEFQKQCEEYLVIIVQQKREADEQQKAVTANSEKIAIEEVKCQALADNAQKDLEEALPALEEAMRALESLNKKDIGEIKSYGRPPAQVEMVMQAVMILLGNEPTWAEAKRQLGEQNFIKSLIHFDKDNISDKVLKKIGAYCAQPDFQPDIIGRVSLAAKSLCMWVRAMELYGRLYRVVEPKRIRMNVALAQLQEKQAALAEAQEKLRELPYLLPRVTMMPFSVEKASEGNPWMFQSRTLVGLDRKLSKVKRDLVDDLFPVVGQEGAHVGQEGGSQETVTYQRAFSPASPDTSRPARSSFTSMSSDLARSSSFWASFSSYCCFSASSFSATWEGPERPGLLHWLSLLPQVLDREGQMDNPCSSWLADANWDNITELDKLTNFHGLMNSFEQYPRDWHQWYTSATPEKAMLPGEWENACNEMQRMLIVRSLRQDRVAFCVTSFIVSNLGSRFIEPPVLNMKLVVEDSTPRTPLVFILSPGVDPTGALLQLAEHTGMAQRFHALSLGQGQAPIAARLLREGIIQGHWVFLANCHLSLSWMPHLDKLVEQLQVEDPHPDFRLWLSSSPNPEFPISILQASIKMTTEPPKGLKANMTRLYQLMTESQFSRCSKPAKYKKLLFALCFFHSVLLERKKFLQLGWNIVYGFNDSDFEVSENLLGLYLEEYEETPWDALKYLIAGVNYGGHVTDDWDRRLLTTYINEYFCDQTLSTPFYRLSALETYFIPKDGGLASYKEYISMLPGMDPPEAFGQHPNADVASQITEARTLFETLLSLQPQITPISAGGQSREEKVLELAADVKQKIPEMIDYEGTRKLLAMDPSPLNVVLLQEIQQYNRLMETVLLSLTDLEKGIQGLIVMSTSLEEIFNCIFDAHVPPLWGKAYPSQKPLASWTRDLATRVEQFELWASRARPPVIFWLSGFTFPTGFLTAVLQSSARQNNISVDSLSWEFIVSTVDDSNLVYPPKEGVWVRGLYLEGAGWDRKNSCLVEADPMQLVCLMPTIHFRPAESRKKPAKGMYSCPCYYCPIRAGSSDRASFIIGIDLRSGTMTSDHWIKRGTALLMSLDS